MRTCDTAESAVDRSAMTALTDRIVRETSFSGASNLQSTRTQLRTRGREG